MTRTGDREIGVVSGRLPDNTGELACMTLLDNDKATSPTHRQPVMSKRNTDHLKSELFNSIPVVCQGSLTNTN